MTVPDNLSLFIWLDVEDLTTNYHSGGGLVIAASSEAEARELFAARASEGCHIAADELPDYVLPLAAGVDPPPVLTFPDAGCC